MADPTRTLTASPIPDDERLLSAVEELTERIGGLTSRLVDTEAASNDTAKWRRRVTIWQRIAAGLLAGGIVFVWSVDHRDDIRQAHQALHGCQDRNDSTAATRGLFAGVFDSIDGTAGDRAKGFTDPLRVLLLASAAKDRDCDGDGTLSTFDYPPAPVATPFSP